MSRRLACLLLPLTLLLCLCGCSRMGKKAVQEPVTTNFSCDVDVQYGDMTVKGHLTRSTAGTLCLEITEPATLNGMTMDWNGTDVSIKLHGLTFRVDPETLPQGALGKGLLNALDAALGIKDGQLTETGWSTKGEVGGNAFEIFSDPQSGKMLSVSIPSMQLKATFSNVVTQAEAANAAAQ